MAEVEAECDGCRLPQARCSTRHDVNNRSDGKTASETGCRAQAWPDPGSHVIIALEGVTLTSEVVGTDSLQHLAIEFSSQLGSGGALVCVTASPSEPAVEDGDGLQLTCHHVTVGQFAMKMP